MNAKNHKKNTNFQIRHFLAGSCHTADGAYALLLELREERQQSLKAYEVSSMKAKAKVMELEEKLLSADKDYQKLKIEAKLLEAKNMQEMADSMLPATEDELQFIEECIAKVNTLRKFKHLPVIKAHEAAQQEEWKLELIWRAENYIISEGRIPADHFSTMRMHPEFQTGILPAIENLQHLLGVSRGQILIKGTDIEEEKEKAIKLLDTRLAPVDILNVIGIKEE